MQVVYLEPMPSEVEALVHKCLPEGLDLRMRQASEDPAQVVGQADCILVATTPVTAEVIGAARRLKLIQLQGVGYDNIDVAAASRAGVPVALTPEGTSVPVAEHVFLLILGLYRHLCFAQQALRQGRWLRWELRSKSYDLAGKRLGIVGLGRIGREVAKRARAFECEVIYYDVVRAAEKVETELGARYVAFAQLLADADIVTLHAPLTTATQQMIGEAELKRMRSTAILINTARGGLVDEAALYGALTTGQIAGAGLDVFAEEPPRADHPLLHLDNVVATPHIAAGTCDAFTTKMKAAFANMQRVANGQPPWNQAPASGAGE